MRKGTYLIPDYLLVVVLCLCAADNLRAEVGFSTTSDVEWDSRFQNAAGWAGADGDFSVSLAGGKTLWLFSDTFIGSVHAGQRTNVTMIHNSVAWQHGTGRPEFFHGAGSNGRPASLIVPADGRGYFWPFSGVLTGQGLNLFLQQVEANGAPGAFGFHLIGTWLGSVSNPDDPPPQWKLTQRKLPFGDFSAKGELMFGSALLREGGFIYVYGVDKHPGTGGIHDAMILARVPEDRLEDFDQWRFFSNGEWRKDWKHVTRLRAEVASEYSVSYVPSLKQYAAVYTSGISGRIMLHLAPAPTGPWESPMLIYECPEQKWPGHNFCYAGKAHPELVTAPDELLITYAANSFNLGEVLHDARLYWPRFIRVKFRADGQVQATGK